VPDVRPLLPDEHAVVGDLTVQAYVEDQLVGPDYAEVIRDVGARSGQASVLVAVVDGSPVGSVTFALGGTPYAERSASDEAEIRMLGIARTGRGRGAGTALTRACVERAVEAGATAVRLSTQREMVTAHRIYERLGFVRTPERDWSPIPGVDLLTYVLPLAYCPHCGEPGRHEDCGRQLDLEPPRYCGQCRRRMVVQVHPTGWSARCVEHGLLTG
jgi:ribosomal protein S18 acetylase RimI-like enzyme